MDDGPIEEVQLDFDVEEPPLPPAPAPAPEVSHEPDEAAQAFGRLEGEMAMMRRAVQHLAAERADIVIPDYTATLGQMAGQLEQVSQSLAVIDSKPAITLTPETISNQIRRASQDSRREDHEALRQGRRDLDNATSRLFDLAGRVRATAEQQRRAWHCAGAGLFAGILLWSILPGTVARAMPESWHWPERMAVRLLGESSQWVSGNRLMLTADPQAWLALVDAADMQSDNRDEIEACRKRANSSERSVSCAIRIQPQTGG